jgi:ParB/Sulfiredoxin domain
MVNLARQEAQRNSAMTEATTKRRMPSRKPGQVRVSLVSLSALRASPENDQLYRPVDPSDPEIQALARSIKVHGIKEPLIVTLDHYILSGHRRFAAAKLAGLSHVPCQVELIRRCDDIDRFVVLLRECNRQRNKTFAEKLREELVTVDPRAAYESLIAKRKRNATIDVPMLALDALKSRHRISTAKQGFLEAVQEVLNERRNYWPLSDRQVHYALLNDSPLRHSSKPRSRYANTRQSYQDLTDLLTRARIEGTIPFAAIADETRPVVTWCVHRDPSTFLREQLDGFLTGYFRDLLQAQPNHVEVVAEKNTITPICRLVCMDYCLPLTSGRGYCSLPPRHEMAQRYRKSGKETLVLLLVSDFDPDGEEIAHSFARSMRDDFGIARIHPIKVALTADQVEEFELPPLMKAKKGSSNRAKFVRSHGEHVWEVEALPPEQLQVILDEAIRSVLDLKAFNREVKSEREDAGHLAGVRQTVVRMLQEADLGLPAAEDLE